MYSPTPLRIFVYGTLKPGEYYYPQYCEDRVIEARKAIAYGQLFDLPMGYPAMTPGTQPIYGVVLSFADLEVLKDLDELEGYEAGRSPEHNEYIRQEQEVFDLEGRSLGRVWVYVMSVEQAQQWGGVLLPNGQWTGNPSVLQQQQRLEQ
jgi:gamma-glutamylcyclotransferase (GGCT)/AIG2-like uncharacterized protein YtfP